jgi:hypothetical protein
MSKLSKKQELDLKTILYYHASSVDPTDDDISAYFAWSDKGDKSFLSLDTPGAERLRYGKQYRDLQVTSYLEDWGKYITATDFATEEPEFICEWLSKVMKKPAIHAMWKLFNNPDTLIDEDLIALEPLANLLGYVIAWEHSGQSKPKVIFQSRHA